MSTFYCAISLEAEKAKAEEEAGVKVKYDNLMKKLSANGLDANAHFQGIQKAAQVAKDELEKMEQLLRAHPFVWKAQNAESHILFARAQGMEAHKCLEYSMAHMQKFKEAEESARSAQDLASVEAFVSNTDHMTQTLNDWLQQAESASAAVFSTQMKAAGIVDWHQKNHGDNDVEMGGDGAHLKRGFGDLATVEDAGSASSHYKKFEASKND